MAVLVIMLAEQTFLNAGPLLVQATEGGAEGAALAGFTFNVLLIARAPLQLFQAVQTSILPHLTRLGARGETDPFKRSVNVTLTAIAGLRGVVAVGMAVAGPFAMELVFGGEFDYDRLGLVLISVGHGPVPGGRHAQPGAAGTQSGALRVCGVGGSRRWRSWASCCCPASTTGCSRWRWATSAGRWRSARCCTGCTGAAARRARAKRALGRGAIISTLRHSRGYLRVESSSEQFRLGGELRLPSPPGVRKS